MLRCHLPRYAQGLSLDDSNAATLELLSQAPGDQLGAMTPGHRESSMMTGNIGTTLYLAPEMTGKRTSLDQKVDMCVLG